MDRLITAAVRCRVRGRAAPFRVQPFQIHVSADRFRCKPLGLCQTCSILRNDIVASKHQVLCRFAFPRISIDIAADQSRRLPADQLSPVRILSDHFVACRAVCNDRCACKRMPDTRRARNPYILTDFCRYCQLRVFFAGKQKIGSHRHLGILPVCHNRSFHTRSKMTQLIKLRIVWQVRFCNQAKKPAIADCCRYIIKLAFMLPWESHKYQHMLISGE